MSEYQYYEFQAVDRPLTQAEMAELRTLSSRATITSTRLVNVYNWGNFRGDPATLMERYFDAFVYIANWGTHEFTLRLPRRLLDPKTAGRYCVDDAAEARVADDNVILTFRSDAEGEGGWVDDEEGEGWMSSLLPLRADLAGGDLRALYLGWLGCIQAWADLGDADDGLEEEEEFDDQADADERDTGDYPAVGDDVVEPPVPPDLGNLSVPLQAFADFLRIDEDLLAAATEGSAPRQEAQPSRRALEAWIRDLPDTEKDALLLRVVVEGVPQLRAELLQRFSRATSPASVAQSAGGRTVGQLLRAAAERATARRKAGAERVAAERAQQQREAAAARAKHLEGLARREASAWLQVNTLIETKRAPEYDQATQLLVDLREILTQAGRAEEFAGRLGRLREQHARKPSLLQRFDRSGLGS